MEQRLVVEASRLCGLLIQALFQLPQHHTVFVADGAQALLRSRGDRATLLAPTRLL
jgi:hypothetical protein